MCRKREKGRSEKREHKYLLCIMNIVEMNAQENFGWEKGEK